MLRPAKESLGESEREGKREGGTVGAHEKGGVRFRGFPRGRINRMYDQLDTVGGLWVKGVMG